MGKYNRINVVITDLTPPSALKVFQIINYLFDNHLDKDIFKNKYRECNPAEQYYLCFYLRHYFKDQNPQRPFTRWLSEKQDSWSIDFEGEEFSEYKNLIMFNKGRIEALLPSYETTAERRYKVMKKYQKDPDKHIKDPSGDEPIDYRVPLFYRVGTYKGYFVDQMKKIMTTKEANDFFFNSFLFNANPYRKPELLNIVIANNMNLIYEKTTLIKKKYEEFYREACNLRPRRVRGRLTTFPPKEMGYWKRVKVVKPTNIDFAKILYNAFPEIRDTARRHEKDLNNFLKTTLASNFVIRDKTKVRSEDKTTVLVKEEATKES